MTIRAEIPSLSNRKPSAPVVAPLRITQKTVLAALGIDPRPYLESLPAYEASGGSVTRYKRLRLVDPAEYCRWLASREQQRDAAETDLDEMAAELGLRAVGGRR